eukprot:GEMP01009577.1.p1 GENE.GEMP01009577.1~~GEMP01009577.1.p1  ORF type:complete len:304 (+),score=70.51 GEMP01009577.1:182-1093(+)
MSLRVLLPPPSPRSHLGIRQKPLNPITEAIHEKQRRAKYGWELAPEGGHRPMELAPNLIYDDAARATYLTTLTHAMPPTPSTTTSQSSTAPCAPFELSIHPTAPPAVPFPDALSAADVPLPAALPTVDTICAAIRTCLPSHIDHVALGRAVRTALLSVGIDSGEQNAYPQADAPFSTISCAVAHGGEGAWQCGMPLGVLWKQVVFEVVTGLLLAALDSAWLGWRLACSPQLVDVRQRASVYGVLVITLMKRMIKDLRHASRADRLCLQGSMLMTRARRVDEAFQQLTRAIFRELLVRFRSLTH